VPYIKLLKEGSSMVESQKAKETYMYEPPHRKWPRRLGWSIIILFLLISMRCIAISIYVGYQMTHQEKKPIDQLPSDYGITYEDISFMSSDQQTELYGWGFHPENSPQIEGILV